MTQQNQSGFKALEKGATKNYDFSVARKIKAFSSAPRGNPHHSLTQSVYNKIPGIIHFRKGSIQRLEQWSPLNC